MPECGYCKDCRHWGDKDIGRVHYEDAKHSEGKRICALTESVGADPNYVGTKAYAIEGDDWLARLITNPDFGCVQFEPKET